MVLHEGAHRRDEDRRRQDPGRHPAGLPQRARRQGRPRRHRQRLPRPPRRRVDGPDLPVPRPDASASSSTASTTTERRAAYACDITYGTNNEFGFDYLRDNMKYELRADGAARPQLRDRRRGRLDPGRRGAHAADHLRPDRGPLRALHHASTRSSRSSAPSDFELDEKQRAGHAYRGRQREDRGAAARGRPAQGRRPLRRRERRPRPSRQPGAARPQAVPARQGLHRQERRGDHHRRVHRPHDGRPALLGRPAPGARGQGARARSSPRTRRSPRSPSRTTSASTTSSPA